MMNEETQLESMRKAVKAFRKMQPMLTAYARAVTGNPKVRVVLSSSSAMTDGKNIFFRPPLALGQDTTHDKRVCDKRDPHTYLQLCKACAVREEVYVNIFHEIGHIAYDSFAKASPYDKEQALAKAAVEMGEKYRDALINRHKGIITDSYLGLSNLINPYLHGLYSAIEDARVDGKMFKARPGIRTMMQASNLLIMREGTDPYSQGTVHNQSWSDAPLNAQAAIACLYRIDGYRGWEEYLHPDVVEHTGMPNVQAVIDRLKEAESIGETFRLTLPLMEALREYGYFKKPEEIAEPPTPPDPDDDKEKGDSDSDSGDESGDSSESKDQNSGDTEGSSGEQQGEGSSSDVPDSKASDGSAGDSSKDSDDASSSSKSEDSGLSSSTPNDDDESSSESSSSDQGQDSNPEGSDEVDDSSSGSSGGDKQEDSNSSEGGQDNEEQSSQGGDGSDTGKPGTSGSADSDMADDRGNEDSDTESNRGAVGDSTEDDDSDGEGQSSDDPGEQKSFDPTGDSDADSADGASSDGETGDGTDGDSTEDAQPSEDQGHTDSSDQDGGATGEPELPEDSDPDEGGDGPGADHDDEDSSDSDRSGEADGGSDQSLGQEESPHQHGTDGVSCECGYCSTFGSSESVEQAVHQLHEAMASLQKDNREVDPFGGTDTEHEFDVFIDQSEFMDTPSTHIEKVYVHKKGDIVAQHFFRSEPDEAEVPESALGGALLHARKAFSENMRASKELNLRSGSVNSRSLGRRAWQNDPRLFQKRRQPGRKDYSVLIGIDLSTSSTGPVHELIRLCALAQADMLHRLGIRFAVYGHSGNRYQENNYYGARTKFEAMDIVVIKEFSDPWSTEARNIMKSVRPHGANLDGHTLEFYRKRLDDENTTDRILMYYTDGLMPYANKEEELDILEREIKMCKQRGYTLMGVEVGDRAHCPPELDTCQVYSTDDLRVPVKHLEKRLAGG